MSPGNRSEIWGSGFGIGALFLSAPTFPQKIPDGACPPPSLGASSLGGSDFGCSFLDAASALAVSLGAAFLGFFCSPLGVTVGGGRSPFDLNFFLFSLRLLRLAISRSLSRRAIILLLVYALIIIAMGNDTHTIGPNYILCRGLSQDLFTSSWQRQIGEERKDGLGNAHGHRVDKKALAHGSTESPARSFD
jgi:hypothetical protein